MIGRKEQTVLMQETLSIPKSSFVALTGRRRIGKTYLINQVYRSNFCLSVTGIQGASLAVQIANFYEKIKEAFPSLLLPNKAPKTWQEVFFILKKGLISLPTDKKQVIFIDELPWICSHKSGFLQLLAHLWNDYLSNQPHFILVICGSSTSWIHQKVFADKGGLHNRVTHRIHLQPFTIKEAKAFFEGNNVRLTENNIALLYMILGGIPFYLEQVKSGESPTVCIERLCFSESGVLRYEYQHLYKALFENAQQHEAIVSVLATAKGGLSREELIQQSKVQAGGPFTRTIEDLILSGFVLEETPFQRKKRGSLYRLIDEYSIFYHRFMRTNRTKQEGIWQQIAASQAYKIWTGYAFELLCLRHIPEVKRALGIQGIYSEVSSFRYQEAGNEGIKVDLLIDRKDNCINLCECKFYDVPFKVTANYAQQLNNRKGIFRAVTETRKTIFTTLISNYPVISNEYSLEAIDKSISMQSFFE